MRRIDEKAPPTRTSVREAGPKRLGGMLQRRAACRGSGGRAEKPANRAGHEASNPLVPQAGPKVKRRDLRVASAGLRARMGCPGGRAACKVCGGRQAAAEPSSARSSSISPALRRRRMAFFFPLSDVPNANSAGPEHFGPGAVFSVLMPSGRLDCFTVFFHHFIRLSSRDWACRVWLTPMLWARITSCTPYCSATVLTGVKFFRYSST